MLRRHEDFFAQDARHKQRFRATSSTQEPLGYKVGPRPIIPLGLAPHPEPRPSPH